MFEFLFYFPPNRRGEADPVFRICSLGIHELMEPKFCFSHGRYPGHLLIFFHTPARINHGDGELEIERELVLWTPEQRRVYGNSRREWDHSWLVFAGAAADELVDRLRIPTGVPLGIDAGTVVERYLRLLHDELSTCPLQQREIVVAITELLFLEIRRLIDRDRPAVPENLRAAERLLAGRMDHPVTLAEAAAAAGLSISRFSLLFHRCYGVPPMRYRLEKRMLLAAQLLERGNVSCKEAALRSGFEDQLLFSRRFRNYWGIPPSQWRTGGE